MQKEETFTWSIIVFILVSGVFFLSSGIWFEDKKEEIKSEIDCEKGFVFEGSSMIVNHTILSQCDPEMNLLFLSLREVEEEVKK